MTVRKIDFAQVLATRGKVFAADSKTALLAGLLVCSAAPIDAQACSCAWDHKSEFPHASANNNSPHLPSNARGVLFLARSEARAMYGDGRNDILDSMPVPLKPGDFRIVQKGVSAPLAAEIEPVVLPNDESGDAAPHFYSTNNTAIKLCLRTGDAGNCKAAGIDTGGQGWMQSLAGSGRLKDVTKEWHLSDGLFRVRPKGGFVQGAQYSISFGGSSAGGPGPGIELTIDAPLAPDAQDNFRIVADGVPEHRMISLPSGGGSCSAMEPVTAQSLQYEIPPRYRPYAESLVYFTEQKYLPGGMARYGVEPGKFARWVHTGSLCTTVPFGGSILGVGKELVYGACREGADKPVSSFVRGEVGMLEMGDKLAMTPELEVHFGDAKAGGCSNEAFLDQAIKKKDANAIQFNLCVIASGNQQFDDAAAPSILRKIEPFINSPAPNLRACATTAAVSLYGRISREGDVSQTARQAAKDGAEPFLRDNDYVLRMENALILGLSEKDERLRFERFNALTQFINLIWREPGRLTVDSGKDSVLLRQLIQLARTRLQSMDGQDFQETLEMISALGPQARALLPDLLEKARTSGGGDFGLPGALMSIAPDDPRVFDAVADMTRRHAWGAAEVLAGMSRDKPWAGKAVTALMGGIQGDDNSNWAYIDALGTLGASAQPARSVLLKQATSSPSGTTRHKALEALVATGDRSPELLNAILDKLLVPLKGDIDGPGGANMNWQLIDLIGNFGRQGQDALPRLRKFMEKPISENEKSSLERTFARLALSDADKKAWNKRLDGVRVRSGF